MQIFDKEQRKIKEVPKVLRSCNYFFFHYLSYSQWERICLQWKRFRFYPWVGKIPWRSKWQPIPVFLPEKPHAQRSLVGYSPWGCKRVEHDSATKPNNKGIIVYLFTYTINNGDLVGVTVYIHLKPCFHKSWGFHMYMWKTNWLSFGYRYINKNTFNQFINSFTWRDFLVAQMVENLPAMQETQVWSLDWKDPLGMATHSSYSCLENSMDRGAWRATVHGMQRVEHDRVTKHIHSNR